MPAPVKPPMISFTRRLFLLLSIFLSSGGHGADGQVAFHIRNKCPFPIWPATASNTGHPLIADGGFFLPSGMIKRLEVPPTWNGRLWARTGCNFATEAAQPGCQTGDCLGKLACNGTVGLPPATIVEILLRAGPGERSFYDVSLLDGYNLPVSVSTRPADASCFIAGCKRSPNTDCLEELRVVDEGTQTVVACKSACLAYGRDEFCCRNAHDTPDTCKPSAFSRAFKDACPAYLSYAFDTPTSLVTCIAKEYIFTFCPSDWSSV